MKRGNVSLEFGEVRWRWSGYRAAAKRYTPRKCVAVGLRSALHNASEVSFRRLLGLLSASVLSPYGVQVIPNLLICLVEASKLGLVGIFRVGSCQVKVKIGAQT